MEGNINFKEFEDVRLKATYNIEIGSTTYEEGETIAIFDNILISGLDEVTSTKSAHGGFGDRGLVYWDNTRELSLYFNKGVFSKTQFALLNNSKLLDISNQKIEISVTEELETDENNQATLKNKPINKVWVYDKTSGAKISTYTINENIITLSKPYMEIIVTYSYLYTDGGLMYKIGQPLIEGYVSLEGKTRIKDDITGQVTTGIIKIPKIKLMSNFSIRLGKDAVPITGTFSGIGVPVGSRGNTYVCEFYMLNDDIDSDL